MNHSGTRHQVRRAVMVLLALSALTLAWTGWRGVQGLTALRSAESLLAGAHSSLTAEQLPTALRQAGGEVRQAHRSLDSPVLKLASRLPWVGPCVGEVQAFARVSDATVNEGLLPLAAALGDDLPKRLLQGGRVDVGLLQNLVGPIARAEARLTTARASLDAAPRSSFGPLVRVRGSFQTSLAKAQTGLTSLGLLSRVAPTLLGAGGPQSYLLIPQNPAEARGSGGLVGGYVTLQTQGGVIRQTGGGPNTFLKAFAGQVPPVVDLGPEFATNYVGTGAIGSRRGDKDPRTSWFTSNVSPHFPDTAQIWAGLWEQQSRQRVDGVLTIDPVVIADLLRATGPVVLADGTRVTSDNAVHLMLVEAYRDFGEDSRGRKEYLQEIATAIAAALTKPVADPQALLAAVVTGVREHRLQFWSAHATVREELAGTALSGELPAGKRAVGDIVVSAIGSKLDYYLQRSLSFTPGCAAGERSTLTLSLRNTAPANGLSDYVAAAFYAGVLPRGTSKGTNKSLLTLYFPAAAGDPVVTLRGQRVAVRLGREVGLQRAQLLVTLAPGEVSEVRLSFTEPAAAPSSVVRIRQPLVSEEGFSVNSCVPMALRGDVGGHSVKN